MNLLSQKELEIVERETSAIGTELQTKTKCKDLLEWMMSLHLFINLMQQKLHLKTMRLENRNKTLCL